MQFENIMTSIIQSAAKEIPKRTRSNRILKQIPICYRDIKDDDPFSFRKDSSPEIVELSTSDDIHMELSPPVSSHASDISFINNTEEKSINEEEKDYMQFVF